MLRERGLPRPGCRRVGLGRAAAVANLAVAILAVAILAVALLAGCATAGGSFRSYDPLQHGTAREEWSPHRGVVEWWYLTAVLEAQGGGPYLVQFTIFHIGTGVPPVSMLHLACTDYATGRHLFEQYFCFTSTVSPAPGDRIPYGRSSIELLPDALAVRGAGRRLSFDLRLAISASPLWHGRDGTISMGHPEDPRQNSFYYSLVRLQTEGTLTCQEEGGGTITRPVIGTSWFDRQWGTFTERGWDWFSLRFFDGDRIMLFCFPRTGHQEATYLPRGDSPVIFSDFRYTIQGWASRDGRRYGLGWELELPVKDGRYRVEPLSEGDFNPNPANDYWEGLCRLLDETGSLVGYCVAETTWAAHTPGAP
jgi:predicted secreted hydrolase